MATDDTWPPLLTAEQMREAVDTTLLWANRALLRFDEMQGCALQMSNQLRMLNDFGRKQMAAGRDYTFREADRQRLRQRLEQTRSTLDVAMLFFRHTKEEVVEPVLQLIHEYDTHDDDCVIGRVDAEEEDDAAV